MANAVVYGSHTVVIGGKYSGIWGKCGSTRGKYICILDKTVVFGRSQKISIRSQTVHSKWTAYDTTKYQTFLTKDGKVCPFERTFVTSRGKAVEAEVKQWKKQQVPSD